MQVASSLFLSQATSALGAASGWITGTLLGPLAVSLCVLAVAFVGFTMTTGRLPVRDGLRVVVGCFVLLGASAIASGLRGAAETASSWGEIGPVQIRAAPEPALAPQPAYNRYTGVAYLRGEERLQVEASYP
jgi:type IV secretion system protein VirB2